MFSITSFLKPFGRTEDGEDFVGEVFFIQAEKADGSRYAHFANFPGTEALSDEEGIPFYPDLREGAMAEAEKLLARINSQLSQSFSTHGADALNPEFWLQVRPAYGSNAYINEGIDAIDSELERRA